MFHRVPYVAPSWLVDHISPDLLPTSKVVLGRLPTPIHELKGVPGLEGTGLMCYIKRDDLSSFDLSGNKVRKLEFLLNEYDQCDSVITIGGIQSNHARATAVAARQLGLDPYLILRTQDTVEDVKQSVVGNLLLDRMVGSDIRLVSTGTYARLGSAVLTEQLATQLRAEGRRPLVIPVGGSNAKGAFGYLEAIEEIRQQCKGFVGFDHIVFACGSGGTAAGLAIGSKLSGLGDTCLVHAVGVCDSPRYFYDHIDDVARALGVAAATGPAESFCTVYPGAGAGYAKSTREELEFVARFGRATGIVLDPVYSGKALYQFITHIIPTRPDLFKPHHKVLFVHTGGTLGLYDKATALVDVLDDGKVSRLATTLPPGSS